MSFSAVFTKVCTMWVHWYVRTAHFDCYKNKLCEVFVPIQQFLALFVRILTFSVFEHCNELPISEWEELYLFNYQEKYLLTQNGIVLRNDTQLEVHKSLHTSKSARMRSPKMAEPSDVPDSVANTSCRKLLERAEGFHSKNIAVQKL